uniref:Actin n=1 Tax=Varanus komodoensis TaxID=61221 RepID=A0A8D2J2Z4_VARKO
TPSLPSLGQSVYNAQAVVIDNGSGVCKAGFSGEVGPQKVILSLSKIWKYIYDKGLGVKPFERPLFMTESPLNPKEDRAKLTQLMFERFKVPAFYLSVPAILSLYASARYTGVVMDSGFGTSLAVPVYEGYCLPHAVTRLELGGKDVTTECGDSSQGAIL